MPLLRNLAQKALENDARAGVANRPSPPFNPPNSSRGGGGGSPPFVPPGPEFPTNQGGVLPPVFPKFDPPTLPPVFPKPGTKPPVLPPVFPKPNGGGVDRPPKPEDPQSDPNAPRIRPVGGGTNDPNDPPEGGAPWEVIRDQVLSQPWFQRGDTPTSSVLNLLMRNPDFLEALRREPRLLDRFRAYLPQGF